MKTLFHDYKIHQRALDVLLLRFWNTYEDERDELVIEDLESKINNGEPLTPEEEGYRQKYYLKEEYKRVILREQSFFLQADFARLYDIYDFINYDELIQMYRSFNMSNYCERQEDTIRRQLTIPDLFFDRIPSPRVKKLSKEAYSTYSNGYFISCAHLLRSILETTLKDMLHEDFPSIFKLNDLAKENGIYDTGKWRMVNQLGKSLNKIIHRQSVEDVSEAEITKLFKITLDILRIIYCN